MVEGKVKITNETGLHARPASTFINFVKKYDCDIKIVKGDKSLDAKSILNILSLGLSKGSEIIITVQGDNEEVVLKEIITFFSELKD